MERLKRKRQRQLIKEINKPKKPKDQYYSQNPIAISKNNQQQHQLQQQPTKIQNTYTKEDSPKYELNNLEFFEIDCDIIEQQKLNILQNSELPIAQEGYQTVQSCYYALHNSVKPIGWYIADYVLKFYR